MSPAAETNSSKNPSLRPDLKISKQVLREKTSYIVKDPIKNSYYRFEQGEWSIISLFDGKRSLEDMAKKFNEDNSDTEIDVGTLKDYQKNLESMNLLQKSQKDQNFMLIENMKELRKSFLLSKKGSVMYKRFPIVDPDKFFDKIIPHITFFWTKGFFILSASCMILFALIVAYRWEEFHQGVFEVFSFSKMSFWNMIFLWMIIYSIIAIHELGHGLTCKYYGGEVHEIGFLLLFFQPCLYCNVNDAWLFDKKWKQVMVTIAGGYIEFWMGSLFAILWAVTNPNTMINVLAFQVMTICSIATIFANFNPLVKLDGYYLTADFFEIPNLRDTSFSYLKYLVSKYIFRQNADFENSTSREKIIFFIYGASSFCWVTSLTLGLFYMAKGFLIDHLHAVGVLMSFWVAKKLFGGHVKKVSMFLVKVLISKRQYLAGRRGKVIAGVGLAVFLGIILFPISYGISGPCSLEGEYSRMLRINTDGIIRRFLVRDGDVVKPDTVVAEVENKSLFYDQKIMETAVQKLQTKVRQSIKDDMTHKVGTERELASKQQELVQLAKKVDSLKVKYSSVDGSMALVSCNDQVKKISTMVKEGDEICHVVGISRLKAVIEVPEQQVHYIDDNDPVTFRLAASPFHSYSGHIAHIRTLGAPDPLNPKTNLYRAEILIDNPGDLRPGMTGKAKIVAKQIPLIQYVGRKLSSFFRIDLFY